MGALPLRGANAGGFHARFRRVATRCTCASIHAFNSSIKNSDVTELSRPKPRNHFSLQLNLRCINSD